MTNLMHNCLILQYVYYVPLHVSSIICSKHVEEHNTRIVKSSNCASSWSLPKIILRCTVSKTKNCRTPLEDGSASRRDLYLTTHNTHNRQTSLPPAGFDPAVPGSERPQTHALDGAATGTGLVTCSVCK